MERQETIEFLTQRCCELFEVDEVELLGRSQRKNIVRCRHVWHFLIYKNTFMAYREISELTNRNYSTVANSINILEYHRKFTPQDYDMILYEQIKKEYEHEAKSTHIFISGQVSALPYLEAYENFKKAKDEVKKIFIHDINIINPMELTNATMSREECMKISLKALLKCDMIYMMAGWGNSLGAVLLHDTAAQIGLEIIGAEK